MTGFWWREGSKLLFLACWTEPVFDTKRSWSQHLSPDESDISPAAAPASSLLCFVHQSDWMKRQHIHGSVNLELCDVDKAATLSCQIKSKRPAILSCDQQVSVTAGNNSSNIFAVFAGDLQFAVVVGALKNKPALLTKHFLDATDKSWQYQACMMEKWQSSKPLSPSSNVLAI